MCLPALTPRFDCFSHRRLQYLRPMSAVLYLMTMTLHALPCYLVSGPCSILNVPGRGIERARTRMSFADLGS